MDPVLGAILGAAGVAVLLIAGYASGSAATLILSPPPAADASCATLCKTWNSWRAAGCLALAVATAATAALAAANAALTSALITAGLLLAAAVATSMVPFFGPAIAGAIWAAYIVAQAAVIFLMGRQAAAARGVTAAASDVTIKLTGAATARADLISRCTNSAALASCLAVPSPCAGVP